MQISDEKISFMLRKTAVVREQLAAMCLEPQGPILSVMNLHYVVEQIYDLKIKMLEVSFAAEYLRGKVERYSNNTARVLVRAGLKGDEKRLVTVKELCHLAIDEKDDWSPDGEKMLENLIQESRSFASGGVGAEDPTSPLQSEALALLAAGELLYPAEYRAADAQKLAEEATTITAIALHHNVPPFVVDQAHERETRLSRLRLSAQATVGIAA